ncbi:MAG: hypothetical protein L0332_33625 [Chloroflexi bacterium]|nr:hypothetical protein [Chloroflexota bacterium]MCI0646914.1 hypothetical protein [Chloroflexota bacterium]MCI0731643.1 hypothetical protein [Chloroflexota bacterium]
MAGTTQLSLVARRIARPISQPSRVIFLERFLLSPLFSQEVVYRPLVQHTLAGYHAPVWHLIIDRSPLVPHVLDLLMVSLASHRRAIPLAWQVVTFGCTSAESQIALLRQVEGLIPTSQPVVVHGDTEFGSVPLMQFVCQHPAWDFILGQTKHTYYQLGDWQWRYLGDLQVTHRQPRYLADIFWTKEHGYGPLNLFAFYKPRQNGPTSPRYDLCYCTTSLPIAHTLRQVGHRRWSTEPLFRDFKSAGWHIDQSALQQADCRENLLLVLSLNYLWATATGRWLCKSGRRGEIDGKKSDITVCFVSVGIGSFISMS